MSRHDNCDHYTYFTKENGKHLLYRSEDWICLYLFLEAGAETVTIDLQPRPGTSLKELKLVRGVGYKFYMGRGNQVSIESSGISKIQLMIEPIPVIGRILEELKKVNGPAMARVALDQFHYADNEPARPGPHVNITKEPPFRKLGGESA